MLQGLTPIQARSPGPVCALHGSQQRSSARRGQGACLPWMIGNASEKMMGKTMEKPGKVCFDDGNVDRCPKLNATTQLRTFEQMSCFHNASTNPTSIQTLSEKILKPSNTTTILYPSHTSFQKLRLDPAWESNFFEGQSQSYYASLGYQSHMLHVWHI